MKILSLTIAFKVFTNFMRDSHTPPIQGLASGLKIQFIFCHTYNFFNFSSSNCVRRVIISLLAPTKFVALSDRMISTVPQRLINLWSTTRKSSLERSPAGYLLMALRPVNNTPQHFFFFFFVLVIFDLLT